MGFLAAESTSTIPFKAFPFAMSFPFGTTSSSLSCSSRFLRFLPVALPVLSLIALLLTGLPKTPEDVKDSARRLLFSFFLANLGNLHTTHHRKRERKRT